MHLTIDRPCDKSKDLLPPVTSGIPTGDLLPPIHFSGSSAPTSAAWPSPAASSFVRGTVQLTADWPPQVRWTMVIRYGGEDRWKVEGVQMGGRGSKRGFFGVSTARGSSVDIADEAGMDRRYQGAALPEWTSVVLEDLSLRRACHTTPFSYHMG